MNRTRADFEQAGRAAFLPGIRLLREHLIQFMDDMLADYEEALAALQNGTAPKRGRPKGSGSSGGKGSGTSGYWDSMSPVERSAEMARRMKRDAPKEPLPDRIGDDYTFEGGYKEVGFGKASSFKQWRTDTPAAKKLGHLVPNPKGKGLPVVVFTEADMNKMRKMRGIAAHVHVEAKAKAKAAKGVADGRSLPDKIDGKYTGMGAVKALGMPSLKYFNNWRLRLGAPTGQKAHGGKSKINVYSEADMAKMRELRAATPTRGAAKAVAA